ncbi:MAG: winged helix-turn-helix domain-containing protein [Chloroflexi bacterium]|nr:winged helix-turn-helix domain-containing protein [Chloroflexota bacterium]
MTQASLPLAAARTAALHVQGLTTPPGAEPAPTLDTIYDTVARIGCVQIDTLHMVHRSHYLTLWSRLGQYDIADFDRLIYDPDHRRLYEYWMHAASIIPLANYRYQEPTRQHLRDSGGWWPDWIKQPENQELVAAVLARIQEEGGLRSADFKTDKAQRGSWWNWKPAKRALEYLYNAGDVMVSNRVNFQRVYDVKERVLPDWVDTDGASAKESHRWHCTESARALGLAGARAIADYMHTKIGTVRPIVEGLVEEGVLVPVESEVHGGETATLFAHRDNLPLLEQAADGAIQALRTTFLNPFDNLVWAKDRVEQLWGFRQTLEAYKPAKDRIWGYYCLPILWRDGLVGRFDPKLERKTGTLRLKALYLDVTPEDALLADIAAAMRDFLAWHDAHDLVIERSEPTDVGEKLLAVL